jgi:hypothetical protein
VSIPSSSFHSFSMCGAGLYTNNKRVTIPWLKISTSVSDYIDSIYWPSDIEFKEPTKWKKAEVLKLLEFWMDRQKKGLVALDFKSSAPGDKRELGSKKAMKKRWVQFEDSSTDEDSERGNAVCDKDAKVQREQKKQQAASARENQAVSGPSYVSDCRTLGSRTSDAVNGGQTDEMQLQLLDEIDPEGDLARALGQHRSVLLLIQPSPQNSQYL